MTGHYKPAYMKLLTDTELLTKKLRQQMALPLPLRDNDLIGFLRREAAIKSSQMRAFQAVDSSLPVSRDELLGYARIDDMIDHLRLADKDELTILIQGGLGDILCLTPTLAEAKRQFPKLFLRVLVNRSIEAELFKNNCDIDELHQGREQIKPFLDRAVTLSVGMLGTDVFYREHGAKLLGGYLGLEVTELRPRYSVLADETKFAVEQLSDIGDFIVVNTTSRAPSGQNWSLDRFAELIQRFPAFQFIQLGLSDETLLDGAIDFREDGNIRPSMAILSKATAIVTMDTFWAHAATALHVPGVVLFGGTHPSVFSYPENINLYKNFSCSPCHHTLKSRECPYGIPCIESITVDEVATSLMQLLPK